MDIPASLDQALRIRALRGAWSQDHRDEAPIQQTLQAIVDVLVRLGVRWCLIGDHAIGEYTEPRATSDVDLLIDDRRMPKLLAALGAELGELDEDDIGPAVRLRAFDVDLVRASSNDVFRRSLADAHEVGRWRFPRREALLVMKFMAATSPFRGLDRRRQDMVDLIALYRSIDPEDLERAYVAELAAKIYTGADGEMLALLDKIDADEPISI